MKKILLLLALIAISSCEIQPVLERWNNADQPFARDYRGPEWANLNEIALYGWFKIDPQIGGGWNNIVTLTQNQNFENETGSRFFSLLVHEKVFEITALFSDSIRLAQNPNYDVADRGQWTFFHFSYSFKLQKVNFYMKLAKTGVVTASATVTFNQSQFYRLYIGRGIPHANKFPGSIAKIVLQTNDGAYKESGYEGFLEQSPQIIKKCTPQDNQQPVVEKWNNADQPFAKEYRGPEWAELNEIALHGWFKIDPQIGGGWNNIVTLTQNQNFENETGSRFFSLLVHEKVFEVTALFSDSIRLAQNPNYDVADRGQWTFFHFSYSFKLQKVYFFMKLAKTGVVTASATVTFNQSQFYRLYIGRGIPHANKFPGSIAKIVLQACDGAYKESGYEGFLEQSPQIIKKCTPQDSQQPVVEKWNNADQPFAKEYRGPEWAELNEIALHGWFKIDPQIGGGWNNIVTLTQNQNFENETGSRFFSLLVHEKVFEVTALFSDSIRLAQNPNYDVADRGQWTFFHFSYSFKLQKVNFYMKLAKTGVVTASATVTFNQSQFYRLYIGRGIPHANKFPGSIAKIVLQACDGAYKESGYEGFLEQSPQILEKCPPFDKLKPVVERWNNADQPFAKEYRGPEWADLNEIALYGWFSIDPQLIGSGWNNIVTLTQNQNFENETGSRFFSLLVNEKNFEITAIFSDNNRLAQNPNYDVADRGQWTFFHFSYSFKLQKVSFYMILAKTGVIKAQAVVNFNQSQFYRLYIGRGIPHANKFPGTIANVFFLNCIGAYKEIGYEPLVAQNHPEFALNSCAIIYSQCNYEGDAVNLCQKKAFPPEKIKSIYVPPNIQIKIANPKNDKQKVVYTKSQQCITELKYSLFLDEKDTILQKKAVLKKNKRSRN